VKSTLPLVIVGLLGLLIPIAHAAAGNSQNEKDVIKFENDFLAAVLRSDTKAITAHLADGFTFISPTGELQDKAKFIGDFSSGDLKIASSVNSEYNIRFPSADVAVVTYRSTDRGTFKGADISGNYRWTDTLVKRNGKWVVLHSHGTPIPPPPAK
jgi:ketosteroid isomerase-like protein